MSLTHVRAWSDGVQRPPKEMFALIRDIIRAHPHEGLTAKEETRTAPSSSSSSSSTLIAEEMKRSREELDERKAAGRPEEKRSKTTMKAKKEEEEEKEEKVVIQGRTEKKVECMPAKVIEKIHEIETTRVRPIIHRDRYQVGSSIFIIIIFMLLTSSSSSS